MGNKKQTVVVEIPKDKLYTPPPNAFTTNKPLIKLNGWQTVADYAKQHGYSVQKVTNWIYRENGKVDSIRVKELNNLLLVKEKKI